MERTEERTGELKIEITQSELQGENRKKWTKPQGYAEYNKRPNIWIITVLKERIKDGKTIQNNNGWKFPKLGKSHKPTDSR